MKSQPFCATRKSRMIVAGVAVVAATLATITIGQSGVTGAEKKNSATFSVAGDGELPTKRPDLGDSRDPLTTQETGYAIHLASTDSTIPTDATNVLGKPGPEFLYAELPSDVDSTGRKASIALYDYTGNKTYHQLVDLRNGTVEDSHSARRLQPPPSPNEATAAIKIALDASRPLPLKAQFEKSEGIPLVSPEQVSYVAGSWTFDDTSRHGQECGIERCAQLIVKTTSGVYLDTTGIVINLSRGQVVQLGSNP